MSQKWTKVFGVLVLLLVTFAFVAMAISAQEPQSETPLRGFKNFTPVTDADRAIYAESQAYKENNMVSSTNRYFVQMADPTTAEIWIAAQEGDTLLRANTAQAYTENLAAKQTALSARIVALDGKVIANFQKVFNGLAVEIDAENLRELAQLPGVVNISPISDYSLHLDDTVPWTGASIAQDAGYDGSGITVAVIDSGIDYTHEHLGGSGLITDTQQAIAEASMVADPALYPTSKVIGGYDFVGSNWPNTAEEPDPNPMDDEAGGVDGHGTHVASIIAGVDTTSSGGVGPGVAPGAELYALKVCSSIATSCSGVAIAQAYEFSADPNGDSMFDDRVDVVNLSLGSNYGQTGSADDGMINLLSALGTTVVSSAGNGGNNPYIQGSPSSAQTAISVAQSSVPNAFAAEFVITDPVSITGSSDVVHYSWSATWDSTISGEVYHTNNTGCAADDFPAEANGKIVMVWRGGCFFSDKVYYAQEAGATAAIVALVDSSDPFNGAQGSFYDQITISGFNIRQAPGQAILGEQEAGRPASVILDPGIGTPLPDTMVGSSSRGPRFDLNYLKPEISAPGASVSANSGDQGYSTFGGTSGASPMVAGAAALLLEANGGSGSITPAEVKAFLLNNAEPVTWQDVQGGMLNPISRQGAGRLDAIAAVNADVVAWIPAEGQSALSFGYEPIGGAYADSKTVEVVNNSGSAKDYDVLVTYRYPDDMDLDVDVTASTTSLNVASGGSATFDVDLAVAGPENLKDWAFGSGSRFNNGDALTDMEVDGFVTLYEADGNARVRVTHAASDAPNVDVYVDGLKVLSNVAYRVTTDYLVLPPDSYLVQVTPNGAPTSSAVISETFALSADTDYTVAAVGEIGEGTFDHVVNVDNNAAPAAGTAHVRAAHYSPNAPAVDVIGISVADPGITATLASSLTYSNTNTVTPVPAGTYTVEVRLSATSDLVMTLSDVTLSDGLVYTAFAMGNAGDVPPTQLVVQLAGYMPDGLSLPFHFLPRKAADLSVATDELSVVNYPMSTTLEIDNSSPITGNVEVYPLFDINPPNFQMPGNDTQPVDLACVGADLYPDTGATILAFPIGTYEMRSHPVNVQHWVLVDVDKDGTDDYMVRNEDLGDGRWVAVQYDLSDPDDPGSIYFFLDSSLNSNMMVLLLVVFDEITSFNFKVESYDAYFGDDDG